ncbi:MAG: acyl--CoA ligase [Candidatus Schekmanbacteria bacterium]|nr:acyl--CoA ligase [Candidatus Schekmanbacteria bacterium]
MTGSETRNSVRDLAHFGRAAARMAWTSGVWESIHWRGVASLLRGATTGTSGMGILHELHAAQLPTKTALVFRDIDTGTERAWSYAALNAAINRVARRMQALGVRRGDRVLLALENCPELVMASYATFRLGAAPVPVSYHLKTEELARLVAAAEPRLLVHGRANAAAVAGQATWNIVEDPADGEKSEFPSLSLRLRREDDGNSILFTSGTTGKPKGMVIGQTLGTATAFALLVHRLGLHQRDRVLICSPLYHAAGQAFFHLTSALGGTLFLHSQFDASTTLNAFRRDGISTSFLVPTMVSRILELPAAERRRFSSATLRRLMIGAAPFFPELKRQALALFGAALHEFYGATEVGVVTLACPRDLRERPETVGRILDEATVQIRDPDNKVLPPGEVGEVHICSPAMATRYGQQEASRPDAFVSCGDLGMIDAAGYLTLKGRADDMIITGGVNVYPTEIEACLLRHPAVIDAAVVGVPDRRWGEGIWAFVVSPAGVSAEALQAHVRAHLAAFKVPKHVRHVAELPRGSTGKVLHRQLRAAAVAELESSSASCS